MARGRNGARKKPETSSSVDKGRAREFMLERARVFPSQKEKRDFIVVIFCRDMALWGSCTRAGHRPSAFILCPSQTAFTSAKTQIQSLE